jgi:hypothetical protein
MPALSGETPATMFDDASIAGTFTATGPDSQSMVTTFSGSFDATICAH